MFYKYIYIYIYSILVLILSVFIIEKGDKMNAIILVAGMGTRLYPLSKYIPKPLIKVNNETFLERQIMFLKESGINDITLVTGYLKEKFNFLKKKYNVDIVYNNKYNIYNNIYSLYLVRHLLNETYILNGDIFYKNNPFNNRFEKTTYISPKKQYFNNEWVLSVDSNNKLEKISISSGENEYIICGGAYFNKNNSLILKKHLEDIYKNKKKLLKTYYWDNIVLEHFDEMDDIYIHHLNDNDIYEVDTLYEYYNLKNLIENK